MDKNRHYPRCSIMGEGEFIYSSLKKGEKFRVIDMSASGIRLTTDREIQPGTVKDFRIRFDGYVFEVVLNVKAELVRQYKTEAGYEYAFKFLGLTQKERVEIDELMRHSCGLRFEFGPKLCEDGDCEFLRSKAKAH